jgi:RHH-type proline utilization regulon transcriptional repressor/proline dehydrogenase/delta 1-pyrroline-5-carboxylate dehydrogenase
LRARRVSYVAAPLIGGKPRVGAGKPVLSPADQREVVGQVIEASIADVGDAMATAQAAFPAWEGTPASERAAALDSAAERMQGRLPELVALIVREGGRTQADAVSEVREAIDFCRYYAAQAREKFSEPILLPGPTGERNSLSLHGRGVFVCISPWNFPLAIFVGQIAAALAAGNCVVAKPAEQTPLVAALAVDLLHMAGIPAAALAFLPGDGRIGAAMVAARECAGVAFTGSTEVARIIARSLADKDGPIVPLIAETGGQNALIADSSALPEQIVRDVVASAFNSAGQRCSALRVLFIQSDIADKVEEMLAGAMQELRVGNPSEIATDVGPVIDEAARGILAAHSRWLDSFATSIHTCSLDEQATAHGTFFAPRAYEIDSLSRLEREVFGPILHIIRWRAEDLDEVCERHRQHRLRPDARHPQPHRRNDQAHHQPPACRQYLRQPQRHRRRRRRPAFRRRGAFRYRSEGRRAALSVSFRQRAHALGRHHGSRGQCRADGARRRRLREIRE